MSTLTRRSFLKRAALAGAATAFTASSWARIAGSNEDIRVAVLGLNGRGKNHLASLAKIPGVRVVALCDPDSTVLARATQSVGGGVESYADLRELLASPNVDAVTIAMPNHWHALAGIWACQAGKDVYVEKPVSHSIWEGRQLAAAAGKYGRVVQAGTQIRSGEGLIEAVAWVRAGNLGKISAARGFCSKFRGSIGQTSGPQPVPASVDYDLWCGPAPKDPLRRKQLHYDWHWQFVTGDGDVGNQGAHQMDVARWFLGEAGLPRHTLSVGGRLGYSDDGDTPNTLIVIHDYATAPLIFEVRGLPAQRAANGDSPSGVGGADGASARGGLMDQYRGVAVGNIIDCEGGSLVTASYFDATAYDHEGKIVKTFKGKDRHMANFIDVVRSRKIAALYSPIDEGDVSSTLCHLGNLSYRLGAAVPADQLREKIKGDTQFAEAYGRMVEHLGKNGVDLEKTPATLGVSLALDSSGEHFMGKDDARANELLRGTFRKPFVVPQVLGG